MSLLSRLDQLLYARVTRKWPETKLVSYADRVVASHNEAVIPSAIRRQFEVIDAKAATLLVHSSMMVAAIGIIATVLADDRFQEAVMTVEIMLFLVVSIVCLRCTALSREPTEAGSTEESTRRELILRRELFIFCNTATIYLTILVLVTLPVVLYL